MGQKTLWMWVNEEGGEGGIETSEEAARDAVYNNMRSCGYSPEDGNMGHVGKVTATGELNPEIKWKKAL